MEVYMTNGRFDNNDKENKGFKEDNLGNTDNF